MNAIQNAPLLLEKEAPIAWIKLNRIEVHNALNTELLKDLLKACESIAQDPDIRVAVIIGSGHKVFCAGADLSERKGMTEGQVLDYLQLIQKVMLAIESLPKPVIAAINGSAFGGGCELTLACDLRVMVEEAVLKLTEVRLGIIPGAGGTQRLPRLIGKSKAKEMILSASPLSAKEAHHLGLVHKVVPAGSAGTGSYHDGLLETCRAWAKEIALAAPLSLAQAKAAIDDGYDRDLQAGLAIETKSYLRLINTKDRLEGLKAFAEKRPAVFIGE